MEDGDTIAEQSTLGQRVFAELQLSILNGQYLPGAKLTLRKLAEKLDTSIQPVREAVGRLAADGALIASPNRSIMVPILSKAELDEINSMRLMVEGEAAARFAERATGDEIAALLRMNEDLRSNYLSADTVGTVTGMHRFGLMVARGARSPVLEAALFALRVRLGPHFAEALSVPTPFDPEFLQFTVHINHQIILAFEDRDPVRARDLRRADMMTLQRFLYKRLGLETRKSG